MSDTYYTINQLMMLLNDSIGDGTRRGGVVVLELGSRLTKKKKGL